MSPRSAWKCWSTASRPGNTSFRPAKRGTAPPLGDYKPTRMHKKYYSKKYHNSPMPNSIFFNGGIAVHGTYEVARLGKPASHGCVRLHPSDAAQLFGLVQSHGMHNARIVVTN